jgi:hypothetical protein
VGYFAGELTVSDIDFDREQTLPPELKIEVAQRAHDRISELHRTYFEAASKSAELAVKTSVLVNGGAAVAVLGFLGVLLQKETISPKQVADVSASLIWFASGVGAGIVALAFIYLMNYSSAGGVRWRKLVFEQPFFQETSRTRSMRHIYTVAHIIAVLVSLVSVGLFIYGVVDIRNSISQLSKIESMKNIPSQKVH